MLSTLLITALVLATSLLVFLRWRDVQARPFEELAIRVARHDVLASLGSPQESLTSSAALEAAADDWNILCSEREDEIPGSAGRWDRRARLHTSGDGVLRRLPDVEEVVDFYWAGPFVGYLLYYDSDQMLSRVLRCAP